MTTHVINIAGHSVGPGHPPFVIAEIGQAHDGSLGTAHAFIDIAADCGVSAVKFQTHIADAESTLDEAFRVKFSRQDKTRFDYWRRMEFQPEQWQGLSDHARERGLVFLSSAFSRAAVELLDRIGMPAWKIGSGETVTGELIDMVIGTDRPILVSTGMSYWSEIDAIASRLRQARAPHALLQCTSRYPSSFSDTGLNVIDEMRSRYTCPVGLSDHTGSLWPAIAAVARGADLVEVHLALHPKAFGPDVPASLTPEGLRQLCEACSAIGAMRTNPVDKDAVAAEMSSMRGLFAKSVAPSRALPAGHVLTTGDLTLKKPGTGLAPASLQSLLGRKLTKAVTPDRLLTAEDVGGV